MNVRELLVEPTDYLAPAKILDGLSAADAERRPAAHVHSVAEVVAHMTFWLEWFMRRCRGEAVPQPTSAAPGWPAIEPGSWPAWRERFLRGLDEIVAEGGDAAHLNAPVQPPIEFPALAHLTIGDALTHVATHNAHHLGQVITIRQLLERWPPPAGSYTW